MRNGCDAGRDADARDRDGKSKGPKGLKGMGMVIEVLRMRSFW